MSTSKLINNNNNHLKCLFEKHQCKLADTMILRWLCEMDGENTEEDWRIYTNSFKLDGSNIHPSVKKVFEGSLNTISYYRKNYTFL